MKADAKFIEIRIGQLDLPTLLNVADVTMLQQALGGEQCSIFLRNGVKIDCADSYASVVARISMAASVQQIPNGEHSILRRG